MKKLKFWRCPHLCSVPAVKQMKSIENSGLLVLSFFCLLVAFWCRDYRWIAAGLVLNSVLTLFILIKSIFLASDSFKVKFGTKRYKAYVRPFQNAWQIKMVEKKGNNKVVINVAEYDYELLKPNKSFIYCALENEEWYLVSARSDVPLCLGKRVGKTIFMPQKTSEGCICLNVLDNDDITRITTEKAVIGTYYIPPIEQKRIIITQCEGLHLQTPDDYLITREKNGEYTVYGIFFNLDNMRLAPLCRPVCVPSIIIRESQDTIILVLTNGKYKELCRKRDIKRKVSDIIIEITDNYRIGGVVWKYEPFEQKLVKLYEGNFHAIRFDNGEIIGDNGWEYAP